MRFFYGIDKDGRKTTTAVIVNASDYAQKIVAKKLGISKDAFERSSLNHQFGLDDSLESTLNISSLEINPTYRATVKCYPDDEYSSDKGAQIAANKAYDHMKQAANKAIKRWQKKMLLKIIGANPDTFEEALSEIRKKNCKCEGCTNCKDKQD